MRSHRAIRGRCSASSGKCVCPSRKTRLSGISTKFTVRPRLIFHSNLAPPAATVQRKVRWGSASLRRHLNKAGSNVSHQLANAKRFPGPTTIQHRQDRSHTARSCMSFSWLHCAAASLRDPTRLDSHAKAQRGRGAKNGGQKKLSILSSLDAWKRFVQHPDVVDNHELHEKAPKETGLPRSGFGVPTIHR